jgi:hypothetical protein
MEILSKTDPKYENRKFNLYLRTAFIYLMCFIRPTINNIFSFSVNPVSTYAMYKYYHASNEELDEFVKENHLTPETFTVENAVQFHEYFKEKNTKTEETAREELADMLEEFSMEDLSLEEKLEGLGGWNTEEEAIEFIMTTMNSEAISLSLSLKEPNIKEFLLDTLSKIPIRCNEIAGGTRRKKKPNRRKTFRSHHK